MDSRYLTKSQLALYDFLAEFFQTERRWPTYEEIMNHFDWSSPNSVARGLKVLIEKEYLIKDEKGYAFTDRVPGETDVPAVVLEHNKKQKQEA